MKTRIITFVPVSPEPGKPALSIAALEGHHHYEVTGFPDDPLTILFQSPADKNGITPVALLAVLADHLKGQGEEDALLGVEDALEALGVEHKPAKKKKAAKKKGGAK
jgi:hypothetical protein